MWFDSGLDPWLLLNFSMKYLFVHLSFDYFICSLCWSFKVFSLENCFSTEIFKKKKYELNVNLHPITYTNASLLFIMRFLMTNGEKRVDPAHWQRVESAVISINWSHIFLSAQTTERPFSHQRVYKEKQLIHWLFTVSFMKITPYVDNRDPIWLPQLMVAQRNGHINWKNNGNDKYCLRGNGLRCCLVHWKAGHFISVDVCVQCNHLTLSSSPQPNLKALNLSFKTQSRM